MSYNDKNLSPYPTEQFEEMKFKKRIKMYDTFIVILLILAAAVLFTPYKWLVFVVLAVFFLFNKIFFAKLKSDTKKYFDLVDGKEEE